MSKHNHTAQREGETLTKSDIVQEPEKLHIEEMPLETMRDYMNYNDEARKINKKLRQNKYPIKQTPVELHPKQRVKFGNNDKSSNPIPVFISNHLIHFDQKLTPGQIYDLPVCIVRYLSEKGYPIWGWIEGKNGEKETAIVGKSPRFSLVTLMQE